MIPCLYEETETAFTTNGIGKLCDALSCLVTEKRNGAYELKMEYPSFGIHAEDVIEGNIILAKPSERATAQPFRIYKITTPLTGLLEIQARHIQYQENFITVSPFSARGSQAAMAALKSHVTTDCPFEFWTDIDSATVFTITSPATVRGCLGGMDGSMLDTYGGEYEWDMYTALLHGHRGADHGVKIVYGKNLIDFKMERSIENMITGVHPYWKHSEDGTLMELPEKVVTIEHDGPYEKISVLDCTSQFEEKPTEAQLRNYVKKYLQNTSLTEPDIDIKIDFFQLWQTPGYQDIAEAERVSLCDTVHVYISKLGIEVSCKVTETEYDVLLERYKSITLSNAAVYSRNSSLSGSLGSLRDEAQLATEAVNRVETQVTDIRTLTVQQEYFNALASGLFGLHYSSGVEEDGSTIRYAHTSEKIEDSAYACDVGYQFLAYWYDDNGEYVSRTSDWTNSYAMPANRHFRLWVSEAPIDITADIDTSVFAQSIHATNGINARITVAESEISELTDGMQKCYSGKELVNLNFENGSMIDNFPFISAAYKYQAVTPDSTVYDRNVRIKAEDGYQFVAYWYNENDEYISRNGSARTEFAMPAGRHFRLLVTLNPPDRTVTVSKETFKSNIYIESVLSERIASLEESTLTTLPEYIKNTVAYKPLGVLSKGYICLTCDDGTEGLATYTIPMLIEKGVPATFGLLKTSAVLTEQTYLSTLLDAITNHGCCVAQHGSVQWPTFTESELNDYFDETAELFEAAGISEIHGAICPGGASDDTSVLVQAIAGGRFGAVFSGGTHGEIEYGNYHCSGPRTNMYAMNRKSVIGFTNAEQYRDAIDEAYENHYILCPFWHDYTIVDSSAYKEIIEGMIDYALEKGLTFITMADLPFIK